MAKENVGLKIKANAKEASKSLNALDKDLGKLDKSLNKIGNSIKQAFNATPIIAYTKAIGNIMNMMVKASEAEAGYIESMNLLNVSYHTNTDEGKALFDQTNDLINSMKTLYGLDPSKLSQQAGVYKQMTSAMGFANKESALLTNNLMQMQQDTASLYNLTSEQVATKFQSALAGQTRAVRSLGVDITQATLQEKLYSLGIDESVTSLNRASKTALIYLTMQDQLSNANGDASRTINQVAQQTKQFREQLDIASRQLGAVFIPLLEKILPIANAILMIFNDILEVILTMIGVDVNELATQYGLKEYENSWEDVDDSINSSYNSAKKLLSLRGFDKLNVITTPKSSGSNVGKDYTSDLFKHINEYNGGLQDTLNKARAIADWFEKWLFYTDEFGNKKLSAIGWAITSFVTLLTAKSFLDSMKKVKDLFSFLTGGNVADGLGDLVNGDPKGLKGVNKGLSAIATLASIAVIVYVAYSTWKELGELKKELEEIRGLNEEARREWFSNEENVNKLFDTMSVNRRSALYNLEQAKKPWNIILGLSSEYLDNAIQVVQNSEQDLKDLQKKVDLNAMNKDEAKKYLDNLINQYNYNNKIIEELEAQGEDCTQLRQINSLYRDEIDKVGQKWGIVGDELDGLIKSTSDMNDDTKGTYKNLDDINKIKLKDKDLTLNVKANTTSANKAVDNLSKNLTAQVLTPLANALVNTNPVVASTKGVISGVKGVISGAKNLVSSWFKAEGGFVDKGQIFIAREAGAEMVGTINGRTAVANNDQIVQGITNGVMIGVARAMQGSQGTQKVVIEAQGDTKGLMDFIKFKQVESNRQYGL